MYVYKVKRSAQTREIYDIMLFRIYFTIMLLFFLRISIVGCIFLSNSFSLYLVFLFCIALLLNYKQFSNYLMLWFFIVNCEYIVWTQGWARFSHRDPMLRSFGDKSRMGLIHLKNSSIYISIDKLNLSFFMSCLS